MLPVFGTVVPVLAVLALATADAAPDDFLAEAGDVVPAVFLTDEAEVVPTGFLTDDMLADDFLTDAVVFPLAFSAPSPMVIGLDLPVV